MKPGSAFVFARSPLGATRVRIFVLVLSALLSLNALAFNSLLQPEEIQDAYSLGQTTNHEELKRFIDQYEHDFKYPADNSFAFVQSVEFETPYEQIVRRTLRTNGYTKFQASEDYRANPQLVIVRVVVSLKNGYSGPEPSAESFRVVVSQLKSIDPQKLASTLVCDPYNVIDYNCGVYQREILLQFNAGQFSGGRATVKVLVPSGRAIETRYDLDKLK